MPGSWRKKLVDFSRTWLAKCINTHLLNKTFSAFVHWPYNLANYRKHFIELIYKIENKRIKKKFIFFKINLVAVKTRSLIMVGADKP